MTFINFLYCILISPDLILDLLQTDARNTVSHYIFINYGIHLSMETHLFSSASTFNTFLQIISIPL